MQDDNQDKGFDEDLVKKYPRSNRRLSLDVKKYSITQEGEEDQGLTVHISPYGIQFRTPNQYQEGELLKIHVSIPDYWNRKQEYVDYGRVDTPEDFKVLAKVVKSEDIGKRGKKKMVIVQTVNMDSVDEKVLKKFLKDG